MSNFNESTYQILRDMSETRPDVIAMFGGAVYVSTIDDLINCFPHIFHYSQIKGYDIIENMHTFCHICSIDPSLVEAYLGMSFEELIQDA